MLKFDRDRTHGHMSRHSKIGPPISDEVIMMLFVTSGSLKKSKYVCKSKYLLKDRKTIKIRLRDLK